MNPEEGDLRPQLLDRFALSVDIHGIRDTRERVVIMERNLAFENDGEHFRQVWLPKENEVSHQIEKARQILDQVTYSRRDLLNIASLTASLNVDGHRADLVILKTARAQAAFDGRTAISERDIALAAELALPHRLKRGPFQQQEMTMEELQERIEQLEGDSQSSGKSQVLNDIDSEGASPKK
jgi:Mg-chelatase subunit ChlI